MSSAVDVLVIGSGVSGLQAARTLSASGAHVRVLEKSRGLGGRAATRRLHGTRVDHGAQYLTARDTRFEAQLQTWQDEGSVQVWDGPLMTLTPQGLVDRPSTHPRFIFPEGMNTLGKLLAEGLDVVRSARVEKMTRSRSSWHLTLEDGSVQEAPYVLLSLPTPQALALAGDVIDEATYKALAAVIFEPCLALIAGYDDAPPEWQGVFVEDETSPLGWIACDSNKRTSATSETVFTLHATPSVSREFLETPDAALPSMLAVMQELGFVSPNWTTMHRWRYAKVSRPHPEPFIEDGGTLYFCGDWCGGDKLEAAYLSGLAAGSALAKCL